MWIVGTSSGSLAIFAAILLASSLLSNLVAKRRTEKGTRSNECYTKELEALPLWTKQQPLLPHRRLRLSGDHLRRAD